MKYIYGHYETKFLCIDCKNKIAKVKILQSLSLKCSSNHLAAAAVSMLTSWEQLAQSEVLILSPYHPFNAASHNQIAT